MQRIKQIKSWLQDELNFEDFDLVSASSDASFRRYFRVLPLSQSALLSNGDKTLIVMDAPPEKEDTSPFIKVATLMAQIGLNVPLIREMDLQRGFLSH